MTVKTVKDVHDFTKNDWYKYAGARGFQDGTAPLMYNGEFDGGRIDAIGGFNGTEVIIYTDGNDDGDSYFKCSGNFEHTDPIVVTKDELIAEYNTVINLIKTSTVDEIRAGLTERGYILS